MGLFRHNEQTSLRWHELDSGLLPYLRFYFDVPEVKQVNQAGGGFSVSPRRDSPVLNREARRGLKLNGVLPNLEAHHLCESASRCRSP